MNLDKNYLAFRQLILNRDAYDFEPMALHALQSFQIPSQVIWWYKNRFMDDWIKFENQECDKKN